MIIKILSKYCGNSNYWYPDVKEGNVYDSPDIEKFREESKDIDSKLCHKYKDYITKGCYGFSLGNPVPPVWFNIIDEFLEYLLELQKSERISGFEIHQIKVKFGGLRFYVSFLCNNDEIREHIELQIQELERVLQDEKLIY